MNNNIQQRYNLIHNSPYKRSLVTGNVLPGARRDKITSSALLHTQADSGSSVSMITPQQNFLQMPQLGSSVSHAPRIQDSDQRQPRSEMTFTNRRPIITGTIASQNHPQLDSSSLTSLKHASNSFIYPELNVDQLDERVRKIKMRSGANQFLTPNILKHQASGVIAKNNHFNNPDQLPPMAQSGRSSSPLRLYQVPEDPYIPNNGLQFDQVLDESLGSHLNQQQVIRKVLKKLPQQKYSSVNTPNLEESPIIQKRGKGVRASEVEFKQIPESDQGIEKVKKFRASLRKNVTPTPSTIQTDLEQLSQPYIERHQSLQMDSIKSYIPKAFENNDYASDQLPNSHLPRPDPLRKLQPKSRGLSES
ncbi:hypothetical protein FGO68_gene6877 [Halteria grandinella]|uniref:Uncharacterized protein n=1 Tax=Halteria grandinella TaxID=5974 RepID=A0A8J8T799_HALGN|nr:hypothetical protein FGO68_gene6877 [Halteria grandinella]